MENFLVDYSFLFDNKTIPYVLESYKNIENGEILLKENINKNKAKKSKDIFEIYSVRKVIQDASNNDNKTDFDYLLDNLKKIPEDVHIFSIIVVCKECSYTFFYENKNLIGILKSNELTLNKINDLIPIYREKKLTLNYKKFINGKYKETIN
ncbi:hypothetical protein [Flavobacterium sp. HNIBRBA15423]|uniref:hypothetical protein n=1 Tax=Flavobacterium sp. HNIBRBA15423 TaxID=3458683 RepID=UPI004044F38F